jgi:hypothetical protein
MNRFRQSRVSVTTVDLVFDAQCPNVDDTREVLHAAMTQAGLAARWREWDREAPETPPALRGLGSPTILVNGVDVSGIEDANAATDGTNCCRVYQHDGRLRGVPALRTIALALSQNGATT